ncbi:N-acetylmuramoyl-L-alanine amidase [Clostridium algidicarnis]|uniref:N-acetylmuramoyl-L-alanine amidase n=1 Tax=Clostridium algidicarnis TaxID=37659 RepID=UPI001C0D8A68|nr:N-acetylmuramoyl-L-alanine amidase [Clostridium algidicarnis]MBU3226818.1 N-acetylmuramoyl-L-alanine amidase [Clostridium algidicarnis]MBU3250271.1 N-acetylmuramoyl-L-alanine amidase [Clostridium algidicarnis]
MNINKLANDYGHGVGQDRGAVGIVPEENVINNIASNVDVMLQDRGVEVVWTRPTSSSSVNDSLNQRCSKANSNGVDLFISHHANMGCGNGHEIWVMGLGGQAEVYARKVDRTLTALGSNSRGIKVGNLAVLRGTNAPAILIEYFFLDNQSNVNFYTRIGAYAYAKAVVGAILGDEPQVSKEIIEEKQGLYYLVTNYLPSDSHNYVNMESYNQIMKGDRYYIRYNEKGVWLETQYLEYNRCLELKGQFGKLFWNIYMD